MSGERRRTAFRTWLPGAVLILVIMAIFAALGSDKAKVGYLIFTYACLLIALPGSLLMPILMSWGESLLHGGLVTRLLIASTCCVVSGGLTWPLATLLGGKKP
jgi:predicted PurR-regulated permease PerM